MKTIKLKKLTIQDWRAKNKVVEFSDNTEIRGYNKSSKSSVYNGFLWLLTGCDSEDRNNYNLFDNTIEQTHDTSKAATVLVKCIIPRGTLYFIGDSKDIASRKLKYVEILK